MASDRLTQTAIASRPFNGCRTTHHPVAQWLEFDFATWSCTVGLVDSATGICEPNGNSAGAIEAPVTLTRVKPQAFRATSNTEDKSIIDWIRTLTVYPEPDAYVGQKAKVQGFVIHPPNLPNQYLLISRFIITCCAADVYPVGLPVKLPKNRDAYKPDSWLEIAGEMTTETLAGKRQLTLAAESIKSIDEPKDPYDY